MEYVAGGNMADHILKTILLKWGSFEDRDGLVMEEDEARYYFIQVINAVEFCHRNKVAHRWVLAVVGFLPLTCIGHGWYRAGMPAPSCSITGTSLQRRYGTLSPSRHMPKCI